MMNYSLGPGIEAFTTLRDENPTCHVLLGDQVHDIKTTVIRDPSPDPESLQGTDALVTNLRGVAIGVKTADCIPILLFDSVTNSIAAIHAGWKGTLRRIVNSGISAMCLEFGTLPANIKAVIGPGISMESFQVGEEVPMTFKALGFPMERIYSWMGGKVDGNPQTGHHINLKEANKWLMEGAGLRPENIFDCGIDSYTDCSCYSARREGTECGRMISAIILL